jgi:DNA gyrase subunit A
MEKEPFISIVNPISIETEMKSAYLDYAMSVIVGRALPDVRDGLKPVHRRVLFAMNELGNGYNKAYKKSARIVGDVIGKYHPHGDQAVYDTMVRMAQEFSMRYPLIDGQGNFGSVDGDPPAAMRYTEVRMTRLSSEFLSDIDKETVDFGRNYDDSLDEPLILSAKVPNLLLNGSAGIAVGMATNIPPHNIVEVSKAMQRLIDNPNASIDELMKDVRGPDFPTAGIICGTEGIQSAYRTGRGKVVIRSRVTLEPMEKGNRERIIVSELPYQVNKAKMIEHIADLARDKKIEGISEIRDESNREGIRVVIELKRDVNSTVLLNQLYQNTDLQTSFGIIMLTLVGNRPKVLNLKEMLTEFIAFRREVVTRRCIFELGKAKARAHILEGLKIALDELDAVISLIRKSKDPIVARDGLMKNFKLSMIQSQAILDMRLQRLTNLEREKILDEYKAVMAEIDRLETILGNEKLIYKIISDETAEMVKLYGDKRRTEIQGKIVEMDAEDLIQEEEMVVTISHQGYIKRNPLTLYHSQKRGGRGKLGMGVKDEDFPSMIFTSSTHDYLLVFSNTGRVYWVKVHEIPQLGRTSKGKPMVTMVKMSPEEKMTAILSVPKFVEGQYILMCTAQGVIKKCDLMDFANPRASGIIAIGLDKGDTLISAQLTDGQNEMVLTTHGGISIRFHEKDVRSMGRSAGGVRGIDLEEKDYVIGMVLARDKTYLLTATERGYGKRTELEEYRTQSRGGKGLISTKITDRNGPVIGCLQVQDDDDVMILTDQAKVIRMHAKEISIFGRNTQGVRLVTLEKGEKITAVTKLAIEDDDDASDVVAPVSKNEE